MGVCTKNRGAFGRYRSLSYAEWLRSHFHGLVPHLGGVPRPPCERWRTRPTILLGTLVLALIATRESHLLASSDPSEAHERFRCMQTIYIPFPNILPAERTEDAADLGA